MLNGIEVGAFVQAAITQAGLKALTGQEPTPPIEFDTIPTPKALPAPKEK